MKLQTTAIVRDVRRSIQAMTPVDKAKLRIYLREYYKLPPRIEPLVHRFKPQIPENSTGD
jgi:hypothetical protein